MKIIQIGLIPESESNYPGIVALGNDGKIFKMVFTPQEYGKWTEIKPPEGYYDTSTN